MNYSSEGITGELEYSQRIAARNEQLQEIRAKECEKNPRKYKLADIKEGQKVVRRWCGKKSHNSVLMETIKVGF